MQGKGKPVNYADMPESHYMAVDFRKSVSPQTEPFQRMRSV